MQISEWKGSSESVRAESLLAVADDLSRALRGLRFSPPVNYVYNPLEYAREVYAQYVARFGTATGRVMLLGMNPGPWGMAQTGVPFGEVGMVREWMDLCGAVGKPVHEHPARRIEGFQCHRSEVSGRRLWGWARERFGTAERFFTEFYIANYCPLLFIEASGRNLTPDRLRAREKEALEVACDKAFCQAIEVMRPRLVVGVGNYAERCAHRVLAGSDIPVGRILHPSPASPSSNKDWAAIITGQLIELGVLQRGPSR